jgi:hypothetical protein
MGEVLHPSRIRIAREKGPTRRAMSEGFDQPVYCGGSTRGIFRLPHFLSCGSKRDRVHSLTGQPHHSAIVTA